MAMKILHVVGARPNFMKMAQHPDAFEQILMHTGQHCDASMSQVFFDELEMCCWPTATRWSVLIT